GTTLQLDARTDVLHLAPRDTHAASASDPAGEPTDPAGALRPVARTHEDRDHLVAVDREIVDVAAPPPVLVEQLPVEHLQPDVDLLAQFCPTFVSTISGTAVSATKMITTR